MTDKKSKAKALISGILEGAKSNEGKGSEAISSIIPHREKRAHEQVAPKKGKIKTTTTMWVDPDKCRIQHRPNRLYELLTEDNCRDLIDSMDAQGQALPAVARQTGEKDKPYEIIVGRRRHFSAKQLKQDLLIDVRVMTDEDAFLLSDAENEGRKDLSDYEKACDWADALGSFYNGNVQRLATAINKPRTAVYRYLELAGLDEKIISAYDSPLDIKKDHATKLIKVLREDAAKDKIIAKAVELSAIKGKKGSDVIRLLLAAGKTKAKKRNTGINKEVLTDEGVVAFSISKTATKPLVIKFNNKEKLKFEILMGLLEKNIKEYLE